VALQVNVAPGANADSVVPFDVVVIRNKSSLKQISQMDASAWFSPKGRCNYRGDAKSKVQFHSWELVPGQTFRIDVTVTADTKAVFGFANYSDPGDHRVSLVTSGSEVVDMGLDGINARTTNSMPKAMQPLAPEMQKVCPDD